MEDENSISVETEYLQPGSITDPSLGKVKVDPPESTDGRIREPIPTRRRRPIRESS